MKVLVLGISDFSYLFQNSYEAFKERYTETYFFDVKKYRRITKYVSKSFILNKFRKKIYNHKPDFIFIVAPYCIKKEYYEIINEYRLTNSCIVTGWVGDRFEDNDINKYITKSLDRKYISDTYFFNYYKKSDDVSYLPLATNPKIFLSNNSDKIIFSTFVASSTSYRQRQIERIDFPLNVYGTGWERFKKEVKKNNLDINAKKIDIYKTANIYKNSMTVLNLTNENNLVYGVNQRTFDPFLSNAVVFQENCKDLELCFDPNKEIIVFDKIEELNEIVRKYNKEKKQFDNILIKGKKRVLAEHTFGKRVDTIMKDF